MPSRVRVTTKAAARRNGRTPMPAFPVAYVRYHDHCWLEADDLEKIRRAEPYLVEETGFLLHETPTYIVLSKERSTDGEKGKVRYGDVTIIMRSDILALEILGTPMPPPRRPSVATKLPAPARHSAATRASTRRP